ncbi:Hypothetical protein A7982_08872 [Minicystis rosea]|nr:Hypothetical protein A7982_08872 [Minicystis rosea]
MAVVVAMALVPMKTAGCGGKTVCIKATAGTCPSSSEVTKFFGDGCSSEISSVDGEGTFDGQFCCYPVTPFSGSFTDDVTVGCFGSGGFAEGGFGGIGGCDGCGCGACGGVDVGGAGGVGGGCANCISQVSNGGDPDSLCPISVEPFNQLLDCACSVCQVECVDSTCASASLTSTCADCLQSNCSAVFINCANDI